MSDIVLCCRDAIGSPMSARPRLGIDEPASLVVHEGTLQNAPSTWTHDLWNAELSDLLSWLHRSLGSDMLRAISKHALDHPSRLVVSASDALRPVLLSTPWEVLEESHGDLQLLGNLRVVRSLPLKPRSGGADAIGVALRVLVTWANPSADITKLDEHLQWLSDLPKSTDSAVEVEVVELTDTTVLQQTAAKFMPNVVYHIGHAEQPDGDKVSLRIGAAGKLQYLNGARYAGVLEGISPRIVILNACSTITGQSANPYLGMAQECLGACDAVICMQTKIQVRAAKRFGQRLLWELADGTPLSVAVQLGRLSMVASRESGAEVSLFSKFVPVQLTREKAEPAFDVNADERTRLRIRKRLETELQKVNPFLPREADEAIDDLLANGKGVAVITGPSESGKSTTVRGRIAKALGETMPVPRILYLSARGLPPVEPDHRVRQMLNELANHYGWLSLPLQELLRDHSESDASRAVSDLATWLSLEQKAGRRTVVVLDDVPDEVASDFARLAATPVDAGLLVVVARTPAIPREIDVKRVPVGMMNETEAGSAKVLARTGGMPYFVAAIRRRDPLDGSHLDDRLVMLPERMLHALRLTALSHLKLPRAWLGAVAGAIDGELAGLLEEANGLLSIPEVVRKRVLSGFRGNEQALRIELFTFFEREAKQKPSGPLERNRQIASKREAMRQAIELARLTKDESWLDRAFPFASELHRVFLDEVGDAAAAKTMWEPYRETAQDLNCFQESEADACYAEALAEVGAVSLADVVLDEVIAREEDDEVQVRSMLLQSNVVKRLGGRGAFEKRVALLRRASTIAARLIEKQTDAKERDVLRELLANVEHTLGNAYGFGEHADVDEAKKHLKIAEDLFDELGDLRGHRVRNERIEVLRYNDKLPEEQRVQAIATIERQLSELVTRSMRLDAVRHLYELGRLETKPEAQAAWFRHAYERAAGSFSPLGQHAELHWKLTELAMGKDTEAEAVAILKKLERWPEDSWTTRVRRNALRDLADCAFARGDTAAGKERLQEALSLAQQLQQNGEGRRDAAARIALEQKGVEHGLRR